MFQRHSWMLLVSLMLATTLHARNTPHAEDTPQAGDAPSLVLDEIVKLQTTSPNVSRFGTHTGLSGSTAVIATRPTNQRTFIFEHGAQGWTEIQILEPFTGSQHLGRQVAIDGKTIVVGVSRDNAMGMNAGAVVIFERTGVQAGTRPWVEVHKIDLPPPAMDRFFGRAVALDGDTLAVAAQSRELANGSGAVYMFERNAGGPNNWGLVARILPSAPHNSDDFAGPLALDTDTLVVGARNDSVDASHDGSAYVYGRDVGGDGAWGELAKLDADDGRNRDDFGRRVAIDGDTIVVGATGDDTQDIGQGAGSAYIFERNAGGPNNWGQIFKLNAPDGGPGNGFGLDVEILGDHLLIGAVYNDEVDLFSGAMYLFGRTPTAATPWTFLSKQVASDTAFGDFFGWAFSMDGRRVLVSSPRDAAEDYDFIEGSVYVFSFPLLIDGFERGDTTAWSKTVSP